MYIHICNTYMSFRVPRERTSLEYHLKKKPVRVLRIYSHSLQQLATACNAVQHTATQYYTLSYTTVTHGICNLTATHSNTLAHTLHHTATHYNTLQHTLQHTVTHCNTLIYTVATHGICNLTARRCNTLQHTATHCNTLQHTATHCSTLQHTAAHCSTL